MLCFLNKTFCTFWRACIDGEDCARALTDELKEEACEWWGDNNPPISSYKTPPKCYEKKVILRDYNLKVVNKRKGK